MNEIGIDISGQFSKPLASMGQASDWATVVPRALRADPATHNRGILLTGKDHFYIKVL
jgi:hypothetical protein